MARNATLESLNFAARSASRGPYNLASGHSAPTKATTTTSASFTSASEYSLPNWFLSEKSAIFLPMGPDSAAPTVVPAQTAAAQSKRVSFERSMANLSAVEVSGRRLCVGRSIASEDVGEALIRRAVGIGCRAAGRKKLVEAWLCLGPESVRLVGGKDVAHLIHDLL